MKILFQGDSVTCSSRDLDDPRDLGPGYPNFAAAMLMDSFPGVSFDFINRGIGGNRTENLLERIDKDLIEPKPDLVSILIGINDVWHRSYDPENPVLTTDGQIEANYRTILERIKKETTAKILLIEPYLLYAPDKDYMRDDVARLQAIVKKLADEYADAFLPLASLFDQALEDVQDPTAYSDDGVHLNVDGACFVGECYLHAVSPLIEEMSKAEPNL